MYKVIDIKTGETVAIRATLKAASAVANRKDLAYGAIRYIVRPVN